MDPITVEADLEALTALVEHPSLAEEFEPWHERVRSAYEDPFHPRHLTWIERDGERPVAFAVSYILRGAEHPWSMIRVGVLDSHRRRGIGARLLQNAIEATRAHDPSLHELSLVFWSPNPAAEQFAARNGFAHRRWFWLMERPPGGTPEPALPDGVTLRTFDGSEAMLRDYNDAYNDSFARHYHFVRTDLEDMRAFAARPSFRPDGLALAYRDGACVGFCRGELLQSRGEIGVLGTTTAARRIGLGRALLRWGVRWLEAQGTPVTLMVDGENEDALTLYRSEGFEVVRTRQSWSREV